MLRPRPRQAGSIQFAGSCTSAAKDANIGGDLYEAGETAWGLRLIIFVIQVKQHALNQDVARSAWLIGADIGIRARPALRSMKAPGTANPYDRQPVGGPARQASRYSPE